jgi:non-specific serine/threonine protein kinase
MKHADPEAGAEVWEFADFRFEPRNGRLLRSGQPLHAEPKSLSVLEVLLRNAGSLVDRDALMDAVWGRVVVTPGTLTRLIAELRRMLQDDAESPRFIATVHTRGYRWIAELSRGGGASGQSNLPSPLGSLIGRDADLLQVQQLLDTYRLVTLSGPAGAGKTQLALESARRQLRRGLRRVAWVDLNVCASGEAVTGQLARALDVREREGLATEVAIAQVIGDQAVLLLLDNGEHVVGQLAHTVPALLAACPSLRVLVTSRATLELPDEQVFWVTSLALPSYTWVRASDPLRALLESDAVRLFVERARALAPGFELDPATAPVVAEICRRLDGLPLALELAAARLSVLTPEELLDGLGDRFALLARRAVHADPRHRSLHAAIEWSYSLLDARERSLFDALGVLRGSWSLDAARAVASDSMLARLDAINLVQSLVTKSLVAVERDRRDIRYRMLESVAEFALAQLRMDSRESVTRRRHAQYYVDMTAAADEALLGHEQLAWLERLSREWPNVTAAWDHLCTDPALAPLAVDLASRLRWYFWVRGQYGAAAHWCRRALQLPVDIDDHVRVRLLNGTAIIEMHHGRYADSIAAADEALRLCRGGDATFEQRFARTTRRISACLNGEIGDEAEAIEAEAIEADAAVSDHWLRGFDGIARAYRHILDGAAGAAIAVLQPAVAAFRRSGDRHLLMYATVQLALQQFKSGALPAAADSFLTALQYSGELGNARGHSGCLEGGAFVAARSGDLSLAALLLGAADQWREATGAPMARHWIDPHAEAWAAVELALGPTEAGERFAQGRALALEEAELRLRNFLIGATAALRDCELRQALQ